MGTTFITRLNYVVATAEGETENCSNLPWTLQTPHGKPLVSNILDGTAKTVNSEFQLANQENWSVYKENNNYLKIIKWH